MKLWMAPQGLHVEPGKPQDASVLAKLHAESFARGWASSDFAAYLSDPERTPGYVAADKRRKIAGFAQLRVAGDEAELLTLAVGRKWRGKGLARALMQAVFEDLRMSPVKTLFLEVDQDNAPALGLYRSLGFVQTGLRKAYYPKPDGSAATALLMRLDLD